MRARALFIMILLATVAGPPGAAQVTTPKSASGKCPFRYWTNGFAPQTPPSPVPGDTCDTDFSRPLKTREGALSCVTADALSLAGNSMAAGWVLVPSFGIANPNGIAPWSAVTPEQLGCTLYHDGEPVALLSRTFSHAQTDKGWFHLNTLRN